MTARFDTDTIAATRTVLRNQRDGLIRAEVFAQAERSKLERAAMEAVTKLNCSIDEVSEATGLTPSEIRSLLDQPVPLDDLAALAGVG